VNACVMRGLGRTPRGAGAALKSASFSLTLVVVREHPEDVAHRVVEERGDEMTIRLEAVTWDRVVGGTVGLLQLAIWAGVIMGV
jgi:hypothetical protein